jgi:hypothetical protein
MRTKKEEKSLGTILPQSDHLYSWIKIKIIPLNYLEGVANTMVSIILYIIKHRNCHLK